MIKITRSVVPSTRLGLRLLAVALLLVSGIIYRSLAAWRQDIVDGPIKLPVPMEEFPQKVGNWSGVDVSIPDNVVEYMEENFADDFFSRRYVNTATRQWINIYVVYCTTQPGGILGHRPGVCYPGGGWIHDRTESSQVITSSDREIPCLLHRFHKPAPHNIETVVLNFYVLNGKTTADGNDFSGFLGRRINLAGDPARYVAQVQISSVLEDSVREAAQDFTDLIMDYLPDEQGIVKAAEQ